MNKPPLGHQWFDPAPTGDRKLAIHGRVFLVEADAIVRHAGRVTFLMLTDGRVRALSAAGELTLSEFERERVLIGFKKEGITP